MSSIYNFPINLNIQHIPFKANGATQQRVAVFGDGFATVPMQSGHENQAQIEQAAKSNPEIMEIMQKYKIPIKANVEELIQLKQGHLKDTRLVVAKMYSALPESLKKEVNLKDMQEAAMYHDYGKVLIPKSILNKPSSLTAQEQEIMEQHSELGYELLKDKGLSKNTLRLIKYHHQTPVGNGYPKFSGPFEYDLEAQILSIADKYSALIEARSYKPALSREQALKIIYEDVEKNLISQEVYETLVRATQ